MATTSNVASRSSLYPIQAGVVAVACIGGVIGSKFHWQNSFQGAGVWRTEESTPKNAYGTSGLWYFSSNIHALAVLHNVAYVANGFNILFISNIVRSPVNCFWSQLFAGLTWTVCKTTMYEFFITRLQIIFLNAEKSLILFPATVTILNLVVILFVLNATGSQILMLSQLPGGPNGKLVLQHESFRVCEYSQGEFGGATLWAALNFVICDSIIMVSVLYALIWRLLDMAVRGLDYKVRGIVFTTAISTMVSLLSAYLVTFGVLCTPSELRSWLLPFLDLTLQFYMMLVALSEQVQTEWLLSHQWVLEIYTGKSKRDDGEAELRPVASTSVVDALSQG